MPVVALRTTATKPFDWRHTFERPVPTGQNWQVSENVFLVEEAPEGGFTARSLGASVFTVSDTLDELRQAERDAVAVHYEEADRPDTIRLRFAKF